MLEAQANEKRLVWKWRKRKHCWIQTEGRRNANESYRKTIPVWKKYSLNVSEAAEYYGIGEKRLRQIAGENEGADFILEVGSHIRFKRKLFEDYLDTASTV